MAKIVRFYRTGEPEVLQIEDATLPEPGQNEVLLTVEAIGLNRAESMFRQGNYMYAPKFPSLLGYEAAGVIQEVGPGVSGWQPGDRVSVVPSFSLREYGTYGEVAIVPAHSLERYPEHLTPEEATSIWMQYVTAYGLIEFGKMSTGQAVLITAAASSVGLAAIELANAVGALPIATTRNPDKEAALQKAGAHLVINTSQPDWTEQLLKAFPKGVELAFDPVGGPELERVLKVVKPEGTIFLYGALSPETTPLPIFSLLSQNLILRGYTLFSIVLTPERRTRAKKWIYDNLAARKLHPKIARTFDLSQIVEAHRYLESNAQIGKVVVTTQNKK